MISSFVRALISAFKARPELALESVALRTSGDSGFSPASAGCPSSLFVRDWTLGPDCPRAHAGERGQRAREGAEDELLGDQPSNASDQADSGCLSPLVSMVQSTDSRQCDYFRRRRRSVRDRSQARCVLVQPQVATVLMIVADVSSHEPDEMTCTENHDVLKELAAAAADPPLRGSVLPWAAKRSANGFCGPLL